MSFGLMRICDGALLMSIYQVPFGNFKIEKWQKYFGCISIGKQGSNASITSMYPMPLLLHE
jgi:hypothetical protein